MKTFFMVNFLLMGGIAFLMTLLSNALGTKGKLLSGILAGLGIGLALLLLFL